MEISLTFKDGRLQPVVLDDVLEEVLLEVGMSSVEKRRISNIDPDGATWTIDFGPCGGPKLPGFLTKQAAVEAELAYIAEHPELLCSIPWGS